MNGRYKRKLKIIRHQRYILRKILNNINKNKGKNKGRNNYRGENGYSKILACLERTNFRVSHNYAKPVACIDVPKVFCLSKNPDGSILFLREIYSLFMDYGIKEIHFNHFSCDYMGICASVIMDIIVMECIRYRESKKNNIVLSGTLKNGRVSNSNEVDTLVKMSGLLNHLKIYNGAIRNTEKLPMIKNGSSSYVAEKSIEYINRSLRRHGFKLTKQGNNHFGKFFGEIVDNCLLHGGDEAVWFTIGHYTYDEKAQLGKCKLCIVDFGDTIHESLKYHSNKKILKRINHYIKKTMFSFKSVRNEEVLYTLFSLQQRVSRIIDKKSVRGNGTVTFIESFLNLFNTNNENYKSLFSITSGKCSVLFDGKYRLEKKSYKKDYFNKIIAFNESNDLYKEPDNEYVRQLKNGFPGTVISMDLYIDSKYIKGV